jgi:DNA-binding response OmpR family regulator
MLRTIKNIRKLYNAKLLLISSDLDMKAQLEEELDDYFKELKFVTDANEALELASSNNFDIAIIDTFIEDYESFQSFCYKLKEVSPMLPKLIITDSDDQENIVTAINCSAYTMLSKPLRLKDVRLSVIMCLNQTKRGDKFELQNGIYFDEYRDQFYKTGGVLIEFTKLEKAFLKLLISKKGEIVDYTIIKDVVWKGKNMSIFTMRNIVNKIRQKTYYEIIRNHSNKGYIIDNPKS